MKREIKFRLWDIKANEYYTDGFSVDMDMYAWHDDNDTQHGFGEGWWVLEQFTGLTDRNGVEIYEGDICTKMISPDENNLAPRELHRGEIVYHYGGFCYNSNGYYYPMSRTHGVVEVIGNVHQNPELL